MHRSSPAHARAHARAAVCPVSLVRLILLAITLVAWPATGQTSRWAAEGNANDSVGSNNGTTTGVTYVPDNVGGEAFSFGGSGSVTIPTPLAGGLGSTTGFTVMMWIRPTAFAGTGTASWFNVRPASNTSGFTFESWFQNPQALSLAVNQGGGTGNYRFVNSDSVLVLNQWQHIAATFDAAGGRARLFKDGVQVARTGSLPTTPLTFDANALCQFGRNIVNGVGYVGAMDNVVFYDHELNGCEIRSYLGLPACAADRNCDGIVDLEDFFYFFNCWDLTTPCADVDGSGEVDLGDFFTFFNAFDADC